MSESLLIGKGEFPVSILSRMANRHGLVAGATGTGKTVTLQRLAEASAAPGCPCSSRTSRATWPASARREAATQGCRAGRGNAVWRRRTVSPMPGAPVTFWDILGRAGAPGAHHDLGHGAPCCSPRLFDLNDTQEGVLNIVFRVADENGWLLLDLKDLRSLLAYVADNASALQSTYGNVSKASVGAIQRRLLTLEEQGAEQLFGEPALDLADLMQTDEQGRGFVNVLAADKLIHTPALYATFLLWLLSELFEQLPEVGDPDKPKLVFFFDEAHLLFDDAPKILLDKVEQVVRLIRSKGVGVYFVTQNPTDVPEDVLGQLGNRVQHALRAFTPKDQKAVRVAAQTFRPNPNLDTEQVITELGVGEALASTLDEKGTPVGGASASGRPARKPSRSDHPRRARGRDGGLPGQGHL